MINWRLMRSALQLLRAEASLLVAYHRRRVQLLVVLWLLHRAWKPVLRQYARRLHYALTAETPRLTYQPTPQNKRLLAACPAMTQHKYYPPPHLFNGHLQTVQLSREPRSAFPSLNYERQTLDTPDGGILSLDWALPPRVAADHSIPRVSEIDNTIPTMVILPGLTGGSSEFYIRCVVHIMVHHHGWQVVVVNARGCEATPLTNARLFCCAYTDDLKFVLETLHHKYDFVTHSALVAVGFSMGSNVLVKFLGEQQAHAQRLMTAGVSVGNPFDLVACATHLRSSFFYRNTYDKALNGNLQALFFTNSNAHQVFQFDTRVDLQAVRQAHTLREFDDRLTRVIFGYESVDAYYEDASSITKLPLVRVPLLCLNAEDDPISVSIPYKQAMENANVILCVTKRGGHLAFYQDTQSRSADGTTKAWSATAIAQFAQSVWSFKMNGQQEQD